MQRKTTWFWLGLTLLVLASFWRLPWLAYEGVHADDEWPAVFTAVHIWETGDVPVYVIGQDYMAPVQEVLAFPFLSLLGKSMLAVRLPSLVCFLGTASMGFLLLLRYVEKPVAVAALLCFAFPATTVIHYDSSGVGEYAAIAFFVVLLIFLIDRYDQRPTVGRLLRYSLVGGLAVYVFSISVFQFAFGLLWAFARSQRFAARLASLKEQGKLLRWALILGALGGGAGCFLGLGVYRPLTGGVGLLADAIQKGLIATGLIFVASFFAACAVVFRPTIKDGVTSLVAVGPFLFVAALPGIAFKAQVYPTLMSEFDVDLYHIGYSLKHAHEWPGQLMQFFSGILPTLVFGNAWGTVQPAAHAPEPLSIDKVLLGAYFLFSLALVLRGLLRRNAHERLDARLWLFVVPVLINLLVLLPSWRLFGETSYRYMLPFYWGTLVIFFAPFLGGSRLRHRLALALAALVVVGAFAEQRVFLTRPSVAVHWPRSSVQEAIELEADMVVGSWSDVFEIWWLRDGSPQTEVVGKAPKGFFLPENRRPFETLAVSRQVDEQDWPDWVRERGPYQEVKSTTKHWRLFARQVGQDLQLD